MAFQYEEEEGNIVNGYFVFDLRNEVDDITNS
jgi:hypothetical protein